ncbi:MAG: hypothetical protein AMXMBFR52_31770 [Burkholderiales bacterium]
MPWLATFFMPLTLMLTTAAPWRWTICVKSVGAIAGTGAAMPAVAAGALATLAGAAARAIDAVTKLAPAPPITPAAANATTRRVGVNERVLMCSPLQVPCMSMHETVDPLS